MMARYLCPYSFFSRADEVPGGSKLESMLSQSPELCMPAPEATEFYKPALEALEMCMPALEVPELCMLRPIEPELCMPRPNRMYAPPQGYVPRPQEGVRR